VTVVDDAVSGSWDKTVRVWDLDTGALQHTLTGQKPKVLAVVVSADGRRADISGGHYRTVRVWDLGQGVDSPHSCPTAMSVPLLSHPLSRA
jgi:WD40 repeat protein